LTYCVPDIDIHIRHRLTCLDVDVLSLDVEIDTLRIECLLDILADELASDIVRAISHLRCNDTARIGAENLGCGSVSVEAVAAGEVVIDGFEGFECG